MHFFPNFDALSIKLVLIKTLQQTIALKWPSSKKQKEEIGSQQIKQRYNFFFVNNNLSYFFNYQIL